MIVKNDLQQSNLKGLRVKYGKICAMATIFNQRKNYGDLHGGQRSTEVK